MALGGPLEGRQKPAKKYNGAYANLSDRHRRAVKTFGRWRSYFYFRISQSGERAAAASADFTQHIEFPGGARAY